MPSISDNAYLARFRRAQDVDLLAVVQTAACDVAEEIARETPGSAGYAALSGLDNAAAFKPGDTQREQQWHAARVRCAREIALNPSVFAPRFALLLVNRAAFDETSTGNTKAQIRAVFNLLIERT